MYILVKNIEGDNVIIGTAKKLVSPKSVSDENIEIYEISDEEFNSDMLFAKIESFDEEM